MKTKLNDPKFVATTTRTILNEQFRNISPNQIEYAFEHNEDLTKYIENNINKLNNITTNLGIDTSDIRNLLRKHTPSLEISWIYEWWKKDQKPFYSMLINHPRKVLFEIWLVAQLTNISRRLMTKL
jgi:hypothetical protein|tara:strand:+ start:486 stop:863 length:378 start_codon:yes stop_codon:yes gene_type:complete